MSPDSPNILRRTNPFLRFSHFSALIGFTIVQFLLLRPCRFYHFIILEHTQGLPFYHSYQNRTPIPGFPRFTNVTFLPLVPFGRKYRSYRFPNFRPCLFCPFCQCGAFTYFGFLFVRSYRFRHSTIFSFLPFPHTLPFYLYFLYSPFCREGYP